MRRANPNPIVDAALMAGVEWLLKNGAQANPNHTLTFFNPESNSISNPNPNSNPNSNLNPNSNR